MKTFHLLLEKHLSKDKQLSLSIFPSLPEALVNGTKFSSKCKSYFKGQSDIVVVSPPADSKLPKELEPGDILSGYLILRNLDEGETSDASVPKKGLVKPVGGIFIDYIFSTSAAALKQKSKKGSNFVFDENKSLQENYIQSVQLHSAEYISSLIPKKKLDYAKILLEENLKIYPDFLPFLKANLTYYCKEAETTKNYGAVIKAADLLLSKMMKMN